MKVFFFTNFCLLRPTTNRIFDVRLCNALAGRGVDVSMIYPFYHLTENIREEDLNKVYGVKHPLRFKMLSTKLTEDMPEKVQSIVLMASFFFQTLKIILAERKNPGEIIFMSRDHKLLLPAVVLRKVTLGILKCKVIVNVHEVKKGRMGRWLYRNYDSIWTTTTAAQDKIETDSGVAETKFQSILACDAPPGNISKDEARLKIGYHSKSPLVVYTGKLGKGVKELDYIFDSAAKLPAYQFLFTGGKKDTIDYLKKKAAEKGITNIIFSGFINDVMFVRNYQLAADVLISYYTSKDHLVEYNLPQKVMEYMFSGNPVVTPDFPATRPMINEQTAMIVQPDDATSLAVGIAAVAENKDLGQRLAMNAKNEIRHHTFENKSEILVESLRKLSLQADVRKD